MLEANVVFSLSSNVKRIYKQTRYRSGNDSWPPEQPEDFTPVVLIHYQGQYRMKQNIAVNKLLHSIDIGNASSNSVHHSYHKQCTTSQDHVDHYKFLETSKITKDVAEILAPLEENEDPQMVLIEGAPGIGKTILLKEIVYRWSKGCLLTKFNLVLLLCLRDQRTQKLFDISDLFQTYCRYNPKSKEIGKLCNDYFFNNGGKDLVILLDGYDEFPVNLREESVIAAIIQRQVFPECSLIISSRPHASVCLRSQAACRVDILGFTDKEKEHFILHSLKGQPQAVSDLTQYLDNHQYVSNLCYVPFNMSVLLFLYKQGFALPESSTKLYELFICLTICRHLCKFGIKIIKDITDLSKLPDPCGKIIHQLSELSFNALNINRLVFTLEEVAKFCPEIETIPGAMNGFGILQAVEHFTPSHATVTFNFLHFSIQEYLAAYYVAHLPPEQELQLLHDKFWSNVHSNMFAMYVALTKGQRTSFKKFLSGGSEEINIAEKFLGDQIKCLHLFRCFYEAGDEQMYASIVNAKVFRDKAISLRFNALSQQDMECLGVFLMSSPNRQWNALNMTSCYIQDYDIRILHHQLVNSSSSVTIESIDLPANFITSSSDNSISDIVTSCAVKSLGISGNKTVGDTKQFYAMISHPSSTLQHLWLAGNKLKSMSGIFLFEAIRKSNRLKWLIISDNNIDDEACDAITSTLQVNTSLVKLIMSNNPISGAATQKIVNILHQNDTLSMLWLPSYSDDINKVIDLDMTEINDSRKNRNCQAKLDINLLLLHHD